MNGRVLLALVLLLGASSSLASAAAGSGTPSVTIDRERANAGTGELIVFNSTFTNTGPTTTPPFLVFLSIVDLQQGAPMDLEDWTSKRSETIAPLAPGASATQTWTIRAIIQGDYAIHVLALQNATQTTSSLSTSSLLAMHVTQRTNLNPAGVTPTLLVVPAAILAAFGIKQALRRRAVAIPRKEAIRR